MPIHTGNFPCLILPIVWRSTKRIKHWFCISFAFSRCIQNLFFGECAHLYKLRASTSFLFLMEYSCGLLGTSWTEVPDPCVEHVHHWLVYSLAGQLCICRHSRFKTIPWGLFSLGALRVHLGPRLTELARWASGKFSHGSCFEVISKTLIS